MYERNPAPGGRCSRLIREGHRFDLGATMLMMPGIYHEVFDSLGISLEEKRDIIRLEDLYKIYFDDVAAWHLLRQGKDEAAARKD